MSYENLTLEVSYDGSTWNFRQDADDKGSNPTLTIKKPTYLYFVAVSDSLTFDATNPLTWDQGKKPKNSTTTLINGGCLRFIDPDVGDKKKTYSCVLNMLYNGSPVTTDDPVIINKPNTDKPNT